MKIEKFKYINNCNIKEFEIMTNSWKYRIFGQVLIGSNKLEWFDIMNDETTEFIDTLTTKEFLELEKELIDLLMSIDNIVTSTKSIIQILLDNITIDDSDYIF